MSECLLGSSCSVHALFFRLLLLLLLDDFFLSLLLEDLEVLEEESEGDRGLGARLPAPSIVEMRSFSSETFSHNSAMASFASGGAGASTSPPKRCAWGALDGRLFFSGGGSETESLRTRATHRLYLYRRINKRNPTTEAARALIVAISSRYSSVLAGPWGGRASHW